MNNLIHIPVENSGKDKEDKKGICNASSETLQMPTFLILFLLQRIYIRIQFLHHIGSRLMSVTFTTRHKSSQQFIQFP